MARVGAKGAAACGARAGIWQGPPSYGAGALDAARGLARRGSAGAALAG